MHNGKRIAFLTLGCKVNQADTDSLAGAFLARGFSIVDFDDAADAYVVNTCTVTNLADRKSRQMIRRAIGKGGNPIVVATGCFAQTEGERLLTDIPGLSVVVGTKDRIRVVEMVEEALSARDKGESGGVGLSGVSGFSGGYAYEEFGLPILTGRTRATLKIEDGCEEFCSYCRIPYARGPVRSRDFGRILDEVAALVDRGFKEIVLTGVHLGHYGKETGYDRTLADVVGAIADTPGVLRVRTSSVDPTDVTPRLIELVTGHPRVCRHLHIPLQGGHDGVLKAMGRKYTLSDYARLVAELRRRSPEVSITTDIIAGFPGETGEQHAESMSFCREMAFSRMHVFPYSPRSGTVAASLPGQLPGDVKNMRVADLISLGGRMSEAYNRGYLDETVDVLVEEAGEGFLSGLTDTYVRVAGTVERSGESTGIINEPVRVRIDSADAEGIKGQLQE